MIKLDSMAKSQQVELFGNASIKNKLYAAIGLSLICGAQKLNTSKRFRYGENCYVFWDLLDNS